MKIVPVTQQTTFVRHWGKWWVVQRAGEDWRRLEIGKKYVKPHKFDLDKTVAKLNKRNQLPTKTHPAPQTTNK